MASTDLVFAGGHIYTADPANPSADAVVVRNEEIIHVGSLKEASSIAAPDANWIDISGKMLLPGGASSLRYQSNLRQARLLTKLLSENRHE